MRHGGSLVLAAAWLMVPPAPATGQTPGPATFQVYQNGAAVGRHESSLTPSDTGWVIEGRGEVAGTINVWLTRLDLRYDREWRPQWLTLQSATNDDDSIVHVAFLGETTRTDVVRENHAVWGANTVSRDTLVLPDFAVAAYEALAAQLAAASPGRELPVFLAPRVEVRATLDAVTDAPVTTAAGARVAKRWRLTIQREGPTPVEVWVLDGRLLRLDLPLDGLRAVRSDVTDPDAR